MFRHAHKRDRRASTTSNFAVRYLAIAALASLSFVVPTITVAATACGPNQVIIGWFGDGVTCLDAAGWTTYDEDNTDLHIRQANDVAVCPDGTVWEADTVGLHSMRNGQWTDHSDAFDGRSPDFVACAVGGGIWVGGYDQLGFYDGTTYRPIDIANLGTAKYANMVKGLAVAPNGDLWVASSVSIARLSQGRWTYWMNGRGYTTKYDYYFDDITVDRKGVAYAAASSALLRFSGGKWVNMMPKKMYQPKALVADLKNRLWVGTYSKGLWMYNAGKWTTYTTANKLASNNITELAVDAGGRVWVGTDWGISVQSGWTWVTYRMENAMIPANDVHSLAVAGRGPALPAKVSKPLGKFTGRLVLNGNPQSGLVVEVCSQFIGGLFSGSSPCGDQVFHRQTRTSGDGRFTFSVPNGKYGLVYKGSNGKWVRLTDGYKIGSREMLVPAGGTFDVGDLEMSKVT